MKKILFNFGTGLGPISRSVPIGLAMQELGYDVKYIAPEFARTYMKETSIPELQSDFIFSDIQKGIPNPFWNTADEFFYNTGYGNIIMMENKIDQLVGILKKEKPDMIFCDLGIFTSMAARVLDIPLVTINQSCYYPTVKLKWWDKINYQNNGLRDHLNSYLRKRGAKELNTFTEAFTGKLTLIPSFMEFDPIDDMEKYNAHYVGPIFYNIYKNIDIKKYESLFNSNRINIFCYTARFNDNVGVSGRFIFETMVSLLDELDINLIVSTGSKNDENIAKEIVGNKNFGDKLKILDYMPAEVAYKKADLIIHHGGHGSCLGQFIHGVPSLITPTHSEREYNARMCEKLHISKFLLRPELNIENIKKSINELLTDKSYKNSSQEWKKKIGNNYNNFSSIANLIDEKLGK